MRSIVNIRSQGDAHFLERLLKSLSFVSSVKKISSDAKIKALPDTKFTTKEKFWDTFGIGAKTNISITKIKENAWRKIQL